MDSVSVVTPEKQIVQDFSDYYSELSSLEVKLGEEEPMYLKQIRPFLLTSELVSMGGKSLGKGKGKKNKKGKDVAKTFTESTKLPNLKSPISDNKVYKVVQEYTLSAQLTASTSAIADYGIAFTVSSLNQAGTLQALFDQYMISEIELWLIPRFMGTDVGGLLYSVVDYDTSAAITTAASMNNYSNVVVTPANEGHYRRFVPHIAVASYSGTFVSFTNVPSQWIDWQSTGVLHYGFKSLVTQLSSTVVPATGPGSDLAYDLQVRLTVLNRNVI
jgi:hypothetical protein